MKKPICNHEIGMLLHKPIFINCVECNKSFSDYEVIEFLERKDPKEWHNIWNRIKSLRVQLKYYKFNKK